LKAHSHHSPLRLLTGSSLNTDTSGPILPSKARKMLTPNETAELQGMKSDDAAKTVFVMN
jgi:hypothetical protein